MSGIKGSELVMARVQADCTRWAMEIAQSFEPDLVVFVSKSGFLFAEPMAGVFDCPMTDILVKRPDSGRKDRLRELIPRLPKRLLLTVLCSGVYIRLHERDSRRAARPSERFLKMNVGQYGKILLVDDSADTGYSLLAAEKILRAHAPKSEIRTAAYCVLTRSAKRIRVDYARRTDEVILTASSRYSKEYPVFLMKLHAWENSVR